MPPLLHAHPAFSIPSLQDRAGALYFILTTQVMSSSASLRTFLAERSIAQHEARSRLYSTLPYFLARSLAEAYLQAAFGLVFGAACYGLVGLSPTLKQLSTFLALITLATLVRQPPRFKFFPPNSPISRHP
jgi:ABC-type multidrug transport system permease subunit